MDWMKLAVDPVTFTGLSIGMLSLLLIILASFSAMRRTRALRLANATQLQALTNICQHLVGIDEKINESAKAQSEQPQVTIDPAIPAGNDKNYDYAIELIQAGNSTAEVVSSCQLTWGEVELLQAMHRRS